MSQANIATLTLTVVAAAALAANRFVTQAGAYPAAGALALGVARSNAGAAGDLVPVDVQGTAIVQCAADVAADAAVMADATGRIVLAAGIGAVPLARTLEAGLADGFVEVLLIPSNGFSLAA
jgi:hypothetical protein